MKRALLALTLSLLIPSSPTSAVQPTQPQVDTLHTLEQVMKSVVQIFSYDNEGLGNGAGTGFAVGKDGLIATAAHVVKGAAVLLVICPDGDKLPAYLVDIDHDGDIAILKIFKVLKPLRFADSDKVKLGQVIYAVGHPLGLTNTVTSGIIANRAQEGPRKYGDYLQTDAAVNPGSSGGPLILPNGKVVGMVVMLVRAFGGTGGYALAIPSNRLEQTINNMFKN